jgi:hypothetical protein
MAPVAKKLVRNPLLYPAYRRARAALWRTGALGRISLAALVRGGNAAGYIGRAGTQDLDDAIMLPIFRRELAPVRLYPSMSYREMERRAWGWACRRAFSACVLGGGTLIFTDHCFEYLARAVDAGLPCYVAGAGALAPEFWAKYGPERLFSPERWAGLLSACRFVGVRGPLSRRSLEAAGLKEVEVIGDPGLLLAGEGPPPAAPPGQVLGVNFGTGSGQVWGGSESRPMAALAEALNRLAAEGWSLRLYCVRPADWPMVEKLRGLLAAPHVDVVQAFRSAGEYLKDVAACSAFVGMRLHAAALALAAGVPALMLEYRPECRDFMASVGLEPYVLRLDEVEAAALAARVRELPGKRGEILGTFWPEMTALKTRLRSGLRQVAAAGGGPVGGVLTSRDMDGE